MADLYLSEAEQEWLTEALYELQQLRGWAWDSTDFDSYRYIMGELGEIL